MTWYTKCWQHMHQVHQQSLAEGKGAADIAKAIDDSYPYHSKRSGWAYKAWLAPATASSVRTNFRSAAPGSPPATCSADWHLPPALRIDTIPQHRATWRGISMPEKHPLPPAGARHWVCQHCATPSR